MKIIPIDEVLARHMTPASIARAKAKAAKILAAMRNKFGGPQTSGPQGQPAVAKGDYKGSVSLYFGELPKR